MMAGGALLSNPIQPEQTADSNFEFFDEVPDLLGDGRVFFMPSAMTIAGLQHIVNNLSADTHKSLKFWEAFFSELKPGSTVALFYADDPDVWHESLITWVGCGRKRPVAMFTPDGDHYVEWFSSREAGPRRIAACKNTGE